MWVLEFCFFFFLVVAALTLPDLDLSLGSDSACSSLRRLSKRLSIREGDVPSKQVVIGEGKQRDPTFTELKLNSSTSIIHRNDKNKTSFTSHIPLKA